MTIEIRDIRLVEPSAEAARPSVSFAWLKVLVVNRSVDPVYVITGPVSSETWSARTHTYSVVFGIPLPPTKERGLGPPLPRFEQLSSGASTTLSHRIYQRTRLIHPGTKSAPKTIHLEDVQTLRVGIQFTKDDPARCGKSIAGYLADQRRKCHIVESATSVLTAEPTDWQDSSKTAQEGSIDGKA